jgi:hypothetical protein
LLGQLLALLVETEQQQQERLVEAAPISLMLEAEATLQQLEAEEVAQLRRQHQVLLEEDAQRLLLLLEELVAAMCHLALRVELVEHCPQQATEALEEMET